MKCNLCHLGPLSFLGNAGLKPVSITSDSAVSPMPSRIYYCEHCSHLQKIHTPEETSSIRSVYQHYRIYPNSNGEEPLVYREDSPPMPRSYDALKRCLDFLPEKGRLLDFGTGNGAVLKSAGQVLRHWELDAFDISSKNKEEILKIPNVRNFFPGDFRKIPLKIYDLIVLWHSLEHVPVPGDLLSEIAGQMKEGARLLIQVPDLARTPFDLAVIDHCSHFVHALLLRLCATSGFTALADGLSWTHNCLTLLLEKSKELENSTAAPVENPRRYFHWLNETLRQFEQALWGRPFYIFGVGISSIWVFGQLSGKPLGFVDMDKRTHGNSVEGVPILAPEKAAPQKSILIPFNYQSGLNIRSKLKMVPSLKDASFVLSPPF